MGLNPPPFKRSFSTVDSIRDFLLFLVRFYLPNPCKVYLLSLVRVLMSSFSVTPCRPFVVYEIIPSSHTHNPYLPHPFSFTYTHTVPPFSVSSPFLQFPVHGKPFLIKYEKCLSLSLGDFINFRSLLHQSKLKEFLVRPTSRVFVDATPVLVCVPLTWGSYSSTPGKLSTMDYCTFLSLIKPPFLQSQIKPQELYYVHIDSLLSKTYYFKF